MDQCKIVGYVHESITILATYIKFIQQSSDVYLQYQHFCDSFIMFYHQWD
jgi:hypothetical protein